MMVGLFALVALVVVAAVVVSTLTSRGPHRPRTPASPATTARRIVVYLLLFVLVVIAATGTTGLIERLLGATPVLVEQGLTALAQSLAFTLVGGPLALLLWWSQWRGLQEPSERASDAWATYVAGTGTVALVVSVSAVLSALGAWIIGDPAASALATGLVWGGVWAWHHWMSVHAAKGPLHLRDAAPVAGAAYGLIVGAGGAVTVLVNVIGAALDAATATLAQGIPWWRLALQGLAWALGGAVVWWVHWVRWRARELRTVLADLGVVAVGCFGATLTGLGGGVAALFALLRLAFDPGEGVRQLLGPLPAGLALCLVGALVWASHRGALAARDAGTREAGRLVTSGIALSVAATGTGIVVNSALDVLSPTSAGGGERTLLLGGLSALIVGGPAWWLAWAPRAGRTAHVQPSAARRVYLVVVFGLAGVIGLVTLLVIGIQVFEFTLGDASPDGLVDRIRAPLGLLVATTLVAGYHGAVWRHDRPPAHPSTPRRIGLVVLVTGGDAQPLARLIHDTTGASVTVWHRRDGAAVAPQPQAVAAALEGIAAERVLVVCGPAGQVEVVPLAS